MRPLHFRVLAGTTGLFLWTTQAYAGMGQNPVTFKLSNIARLRLESLSFFVVVMLVLTLVVKLIWNALRKDFPRLPRMTYLRTLGMMVVWALLVAVVLSMINGARELVTPGAWEKAGATYRLADGAPMNATDQLLEDRRQNLDRLKAALWDYAGAHGGQFPAHEFVPEVPERTWMTLHPSGARYLYRPDTRSDKKLPAILAYEPGAYGDYRFVLLTDGTIERMDRSRIDKLDLDQVTRAYR